jgi:hypothetical protein
MKIEVEDAARKKCKRTLITGSFVLRNNQLFAPSYVGIIKCFLKAIAIGKT